MMVGYIGVVGLLDYWDPGIGAIYAGNGAVPEQYMHQIKNIYENITVGKPNSCNKSKLVKSRKCMKKGRICSRVLVMPSFLIVVIHIMGQMLPFVMVVKHVFQMVLCSINVV